MNDSSIALPTGPPTHRDPGVVERDRLPMHGLPNPGDRIALDGPWRFRHHIGTLSGSARPKPTLRAIATEPRDWAEIDVPEEWTGRPASRR